jgi:23S rRNA pseudouridine2605 synthase
MRLNQYIALHAGISRRRADQLIKDGKVKVNGRLATLGQTIYTNDDVAVKDLKINPNVELITIMLNKPEGYVVSRTGQGSKTIYDLLPENLHHLKPVGRLDKKSSGLMLLTNDGKLAHKLTHPSSKKNKIYEVQLETGLNKVNYDRITKASVQLDDGPSKFKVTYLNDRGTKLKVTMHEGRNRQIRRTFAALGYNITGLHRTKFGNYELDGLKSGDFKKI